MNSVRVDEDDSSALRYRVRLLIRHPNIDPDHITDVLGLKPHLSAMAGTARKNPAGIVLPGIHKDSVWSHSFRMQGKRSFFSDVVSLIDKLEPHRNFLLEIEHGGGSISMVLDIPGDVNIGDVLSWREMARLCALRMDLSVEIFPEFN